MSRPSKAKRELRRKALLLATQAEVMHSALILRHKEAQPVSGPRIRTGLDGMASKALHGPRMWSAPEPVAIASRSIGRVEAKDKPHYVADGVRPTVGVKPIKAKSLDGFTPKVIDALLLLKRRT